MVNKDALGDRMKGNYEAPAKHLLTRRMPVIVRVDGRAFHTFTRGLDRPFDRGLQDAMVAGAMAVAEEMQGFKLAYVQSDEASFLLTDYDTFETQPWFGYVKSKVETIAASAMTAGFARVSPNTSRMAMFDARAFSLPREEVANYFLWRALDWQRNSVAMYCGAHYSAKQMHGMGRSDQHEMLHAKGLNWATDLLPVWRNGFWLTKDGARDDIEPKYAEIAALVQPLVNCDLAAQDGADAPKEG